MASIATNAAVTNLIQILTNDNSPIASSSAVQTALEKASPTDIAQLSDAATQLQEVNLMFGLSTDSDASAVDSSNYDPILATLTSALLASSESSVPQTATAPPATPSSDTPSVNLLA